jgi:hypothetical protein
MLVNKKSGSRASLSASEEKSPASESEQEFLYSEEALKAAGF